MQLNDLVKEFTMRDIEQKTNISERVISKLLEKDFATLKKPQALGAISIIEREYAVDLGPLRQECIAYFQNSDQENEGITVIKPIDKEGHFFSKFLSLLLLAALVYGAWYFFVAYYKQRINPMDPHSEASFIEVILPGNDTDPQKLSVEQNTSEKTAPVSTVKENISTEEAPKHMIVYDIQSSGNVSDPEAKVSEISPVSAEQNDTNETANEIIKAQSSAEEDNATESVPVAVEHETITLLPKKAMWFSLTNDDTKKRTRFKRKNRYDIDVKEHAWLLATKNAQFSLTDNDLFEEFGSKGKLFFRLDRSGIHPLSEDEYKAAVK